MDVTGYHCLNLYIVPINCLHYYGPFSCILSNFEHFSCCSCTILTHKNQRSKNSDGENHICQVFLVTAVIVTVAEAQVTWSDSSLRVLCCIWLCSHVIFPNVDPLCDYNKMFIIGLHKLVARWWSAQPQELTKQLETTLVLHHIKYFQENQNRGSLKLLRCYSWDKWQQ